MKKSFPPAVQSRKWQLVLTEEQLAVMIGALEDWHRFICGDCRLDYATSFIHPFENRNKVREILDTQVKSAMFPELTRGQNYSWNGGQSDADMSRVAAITYMIYREARHRLALAYDSRSWNVYRSDTLTCAEQGPLIRLNPLPETTPKSKKYENP